MTIGPMVAESPDGYFFICEQLNVEANFRLKLRPRIIFIWLIKRVMMEK